MHCGTTSRTYLLLWYCSTIVRVRHGHQSPRPYLRSIPGSSSTVLQYLVVKCTTYKFMYDVLLDNRYHSTILNVLLSTVL
jgi:hypothetical protein